MSLREKLEIGFLKFIAKFPIVVTFGLCLELIIFYVGVNILKFILSLAVAITMSHRKVQFSNRN